MVEDQNLKEQPTPSPRSVPLVPPTGKAEHCSRWQKNCLQGPAAVSQSRAKKDGFEAQRQKRKKKLDNKYCGRDRHGREQRVCQAKRQRDYRPLAEKGQTRAVTLQSKFCPQPTSKGECSHKINTAQQSHIVQLSNEQKIKFLERFPLPPPGSK